MTKPVLLITGASGFIGRALCLEAVIHGYPVKGALRQQATPPNGIKAIEINSIDEHTNWDSALQDVDVVIHLAARAHIMQDKAENPLQEFRRINAAGTLHLAQAAAAYGVKRFVFVSTVKVNGEKTANGHRFTDLDAPAPEDPYGISKWEAEQGLQEIGKTTGMEIVIIRPPLVYGPGVKGNFAQMLGILSRRMPLPLASIKNSRSLVYLGNLIDTILLCATHPAAANQIYLVSDGQDMSTPDLINKLAFAMNLPSPLLSLPLPLLKIAAKFLGKLNQINRLSESLQVDSSKICRELQWQPPYSVQQGLEHTVQNYLQEHSNNSHHHRK